MKNHFYPAIVLNLAIILVSFTVFILLDSNIGKANQSKRAESLTKTAASIHPETTTIHRNNSNQYSPYFDWDASHYEDFNVLNESPAVRMVKLSSGKSLPVLFYSVQKAYYRFEIERFKLRGIQLKSAFIQVMKDGKVIPPYLGTSNVYFQKDPESGDLLANWFLGIQPPLGKYQAVLYINGQPALSDEFEIIERKPIIFKKMLSLINLEWNQTISNRSIYGHEQNKTNFGDGLSDWMDYGNVDGFLTLAGETTGWGNIKPGKPWEYYPVKNLDYLGNRLHQENKLVGAYIMCFYTPQNGWEKAGYSCAKGISVNPESIGVKDSKFASFKDEKRFKDILELAEYFEKQPAVDFIGFDFIRFGELTGYENADEFVKDMNVSVPLEWPAYSDNDKIIWLGRKLELSGQNPIQLKWKAWVSHKTADFIYRIRKAGNITKPMWVFTLGWDHGYGHGQDPLFFQDAGVFADFVMLYESSPEMFESMKKSWTDYAKDTNLNYIPGNQIDAALSRSISGNNPVEEYYYRLTTAVDYSQALSKGLFIHDISRAFWGRTGNHSYKEWLNAGFSSISYARWKNKEIPYSIQIRTNEAVYHQHTAEIPVSIDIVPERLSEIAGKQIVIESIENNYSQKIDISEKTNIIIVLKMRPANASDQYLALRSKIEGYPAYFTFGYINFIKKKMIALKLESKQEMGDRE